MFPEFTLFGEKTGKEALERLKRGFELFRLFISKQPRLRTLISGTEAGIGHQAATINLVRRFASPVDSRPPGFDYRGTIEIWADWDDEKMTAKMLQLMPELKGEREGKINNTPVVLRSTDDPPDDEVLFGFCGADDYPGWLIGEDHFEFLKEFKIRTYLLIQPYMWMLNPGRVKGMAPGNLVFFQGEAAYEYYNLDTVYQVAPFHIKDRAYTQPILALTNLDWEVITGLTTTPDEKHLVLLMEELTKDPVISNYNIVPIYGVNFPGKVAFRKPVSQCLALEMAIYHNALKQNAQIKPPIIINFGTYIPGEDQTMSLASVTNLAEGGYTQNELIAVGGLNLMRMINIGTEKEKRAWEQTVRVAGYRKLAFGDASGKDIYKAVDYREITSENLGGLLGWLSGGTTRVLFIQADRVPSLVFDYTVSVGGLPPVFEGNNTAVVTINSGKPYLHTRDTGDLDKPTQYQLGEVGGIDFSGLIEVLQKIANRVQAIYGEWPANPNVSATHVTASFIKETYPANEIIFDYFGSVKEFYEDGMNDKFSISAASAAVMLHKVWGVDQEMQRRTIGLLGETPPSLDDLLKSIQSEIANVGRVDLLGVILPSGGIHDYLRSIVANTGGSIIVTDPKVTSETDAEQQITKVILVGNTSAFGVSTICKFDFTMVTGAYACAASFEGADPWSLDAVPWIVFDRPRFVSQSSDAGFPPSGEVKGKLRKTDLELSVALPNATGTAIGSAAFEKPQSISLFLEFVGGINLEQYVPAPIAALANVGVKQLSFAYNMPNKKINQIILNIGSPDTWEIVPNLNLSDFDVQITVNNPVDLQAREVTAAISGNLLIGSDDQASTIAVSATIPDLYLSGQLTSPDLPLNTLISVFWSGANPRWPGGNEPKITSLSVGLGVTSRDYNIGTALELNWPITVGDTTILTINAISMYLMGGTGWATGGLSGSVTILPDGANIGLDLTANYLGNNAGWKFIAAQTSGQVSLIGLFTAYMPAAWKPDPGEFDILIDGLGLTVETATNSWEFTGKTAVPIVIPGTGIEVQLNLRLGYYGGSPTMRGRDALYTDTYVPVLDDTGAIVSLSSLADPPPKKVGYYGTLSAVVTWENIEITVFYDFNPDYKSFGIAWGILEGKLTTTQSETIATLGFTKSTTIGSMAETMIGWATGSDFSLSSPWNILNSIPLNKLQLQYNFTKKQVGINVGIGPIEMGFARIDAITIQYKSNQPNPDDNGVQVELKGSFRWQQNPSQPLGWNAAKPETTPAPQGQGNKYLDLRLLALGQHVTLPCFANADTVQEAIACMKKLPVPDSNNIVIPPVTLDANSSWLIGMEFGILRFGPEKKPAAGGAEGTALIALEANEEAASGYLITMQIVFNDPHLYALRIKLDGDAAKVLKGLDFQIMYKKISDTIGMYKAEIALPDRMRFIRMGQCNITLPVFGIEYFTNGDFQVDIGFPWKADFARSLAFQTLIWTPVGIPIPVMGSLGVYFGKLSSATTNRVPKADNGTFNPVLVFGFGIQFGIGYEFDAGILKAGVSLTAVAILEGVVAKFNPYQITDGSGSTGLVEARQTDQVEASYYFSLQGTVGIIGKLFGSIDFAIIKAEVNIDIRILASFTFAPYEPIVLNLTASVEVEVKVRINLGLFKITISFSFSAKISQSVTIKAIGSNPPWHVTQGQQALTSMSIFRRRPRRRVLPDLPMLNRKQAVLAPNWKNLKTEENKLKLTTYMTLSLTMAGDTASTVQEQLACYVAMMFIDSVLPPQEDRTSGSEKAYAATPDTSFETLSKMVLRWAVAALQPQPVSAEQVDGIVVRELDLQALLDLLNDKQNPTPIPAADVEYFLAGQFSVVAQGPTIDRQINGTYFPVAPGMTLHIPKYGASEPLDYTFAAYNATSTEYVDFLRNYFDQLMVKVQEDERQTGRKAFALADADGESLGSFIFNDYFLMLSKQMLQSALDSLREFKYYLVDGQTPDDIVRNINTNAGLAGAEAYSLEELFADNAGVPVSAGKGLVIEGSTYVVQTSDTFDSIAANPLFGSARSGIGFSGAALAAFNADVDNTLSAGITINYPGKPAYLTQPGQSLATVAGELGILVAELIANGGITSLANLPLVVATLRLPPFTNTTVAGDTLRGVAAKFRIDTGALAVNKTNGQIVNLFDYATTEALEIANLTQYKTGELIKEIQATQGLQHLSGMTSRYYMAGLRLPTNGITPKKKGMWVTGEPGNYHIPDLAGLYALTGQQFPIPDLNNADDFNVDFDNGGVPWLTFDNADPSKLRISIKPGTDDRQQIDLVKGYATTQRLNTGLTFLGLRGMFNTKAATYSFNSEIDWNAASAYTMPYGGWPSGVPEMQLWLMPDSLLALPDLSKRKVNPRMAMKVGEHNEAARAMVDRPLNYYGYASVVEFTVKKVPVVEAAPATKTTYEVVGADGSSAQILERIVSEVGSDNSALQTLILAYPTDPNSTTSTGVQTDAENALTMGLAQVNLSTETRPDTAFSRAMLAPREGQGTTLLNQPTDFVRLLWEASITRAGGFYLYYFNSDSGGGLPDRVFNDKNEALLSLIVLYAKPGDVSLQGTITSYMNALVTGESIDRNTSQLFAEADPNKGVTIPATATQTLASIAYEYFENVSQVAADNADLPLRNGLEVTISEGTYEVGPSAPGGSLPAIATWFGTTPQAILDANPKLPKPWPDPLPEYTALYLPELKLVVTSDPKKNTLGGIAKYFGMNLTALASHNGGLSGPFASGGCIRISGGPVITTSTVPAGNVTVEAVRSMPQQIPDKPAGNNYGEIFLQNMYSLLSYQVSGNVYFSSSKLGLPATPVAEPEDAKNVSKVRAPKAIVAGEDWIFRQAVPYNQFSLQTPTAVADLPDPNDSPYKGIGDLLQVDFAWQDLYGNRLFTDLSDPEAGDSTPLNLPPILTGYSDPIIGLTQWPSVAATYAISASQTGPSIELQLTFDSTVYQGLIGAQVTSGTTIDAKFTEALDQTSAENLLNYSLDHDIKLVSAKLSGDGRTVTLTVDKIPEPVEISLTIANIRNAAEPLSSESQTFQGVATFFSPVSAGLPTSTLLQKALGDLNTYTQLWYQLNDPYGIGYRVSTSLTIHDYTLDAAQVSELVDTWLASIWRFVNDRSQGGTTVAKPAARLPFTFSVAESSLNPEEIYSLELGFTIERTGGAIIGDLETTGGIASVTSAVSPYAGAAGGLATDLTAFARNFEAALSRTGEYQLRVATSVDRKASLSGNSGNELWVVRLGLNPQRSISYQIDREHGPLLFAPKPISTKLENRTQIPIWDFNPVTGIDFNAQPSRFLDFTGIDMDLWGRQFFGDIDNLLSPEFTAAIQLVDNNQQATYLETILDNKKRLADIVKNWMDFVFVGESGSTTEIQEAFRQQVLVRLSNAYTVKAGVQYTARVQAGAFRLLFAGVGSDNTDSLMMLFTSDIQATVAQDKNNYSVSGGLSVISATLDSLNPQIVTLKLSGPPQVGETVVTISNSYQDARGAQIVPPLNVQVSSGTAATPEIYGNIAQNFKFAGATLDHADDTRVFLFFSGVLDKATAETTSKYQVSDLTVVSAVLDAASQGVVTLTLSGNVVVDVTTVTVLEPFTNAVGQELLPPFSQTVTSSVDVAHRTQGISLTAAKVNLKNSDAVPLPFLVSGPELVRTQSGAIISYIDLDTTYQGSSIEHQIGTLPNVADYRASTWLSFLSDPKPLRADLGHTQVPMLLRSFPAAPSMVSQEGKSSYVIVPNDLEKILNWDYSINYSQIVHYPQDELYFTVNFNVQDSPNRLEVIEDAFDELAEFVTVYPDQVEPVLRNTLMKIDAQTTDPAEFAAAAIALGSFNAMVGHVIAAAANNSLIMSPTSRLRTSNVAEPYLFSLREGSGTVADEPDVLVITIVGSPPAGIDNPSVKIPGYTTQTYPGTCHGDFCFCFEDGDGKPLSAAIGQGIGPRTVILPKMNILQRQDAETTVELKRNVDLVPDKHTAPEFIYTTGNVGFANPLFPLIEYDQELPVESVGPGGNRTGTLQQLLTEFFQVLLAQNTQDSLSFLMTCTYTYQANAMLEPTLLPVMMQPKQSIDVKQPPSGTGETTLAEMIGAWSGSILKWFSDHQTSTQEGILHFDLTIFTNLTEQNMPLLRLNKMVLALKYVTDLPS